MEELVSVIIPVFNRRELVKEAIMSCLLQSLANIEIIVVDDGSTDGTNATLKELSKKWGGVLSIYFQENAGPGLARDYGTRVAKGELIQYLDSDDLLMEDKLRLQLAKLRERPDDEICYMMSYQIDYGFSPPLWLGPMRLSGQRKDSLFPSLLNQRWWTTSSPLYRRRLIDRISPWTSLKNEEDWIFDAHAGGLKINICWVEKEGSVRRIHITKDHLSYNGYIDKDKLKDRITAKAILFQYAQDYGLKPVDKEMRLFSRECFFLARQTAILGMDVESSKALEIAKKSQGKIGILNPRYLIFQLIGQLLGWNNSARILRCLKGKM
jgi:glycosyltransferase involved in cell wall biosynthesis